MFQSLRLRHLAQRWFPHVGNRHRAGRALTPTRRPMRPNLEVLEDRLTPSGDVLAFSFASVDGVYTVNTFGTNRPSAAIGVQLREGNGNGVTATSNVTVNLGSSSTTAKFLDLSGNPLSNSSVVIAAGSSFALFEYEDTQTGPATISGSTSNPGASRNTSVDIENVFAVTSAIPLTPPGGGIRADDLSVTRRQRCGGHRHKRRHRPNTLFDTSGNQLPTDSSNSVSLLTIHAGSNSASFKKVGRDQITGGEEATTGTDPNNRFFTDYPGFAHTIDVLMTCEQ